MNTVTHFFHFFHNEEVPALDNEVMNTMYNIHFLKSLSFEFQAVLLSTSEENFSFYKETQNFCMLYRQCVIHDLPLSLDHVKHIQYILLTLLEATQLKNLNPFILRLHSAELCSSKYARELMHFFTQGALRMQKATIKEHEKNLDLIALGDELANFLKRLQELKLDEKIYTSLHKIYTNAKNHKFSIGVTGVLSAGKSTFLNALLGKEVLGSSTIPETANLTVLRYRDKEGARVYFWNKEEWGELTRAGQYDKSLHEFVQESEAIFGQRLHDFISKETKSQEIAISELSNFTSANHESKLCNLVKEVELFTDLKFLQNGVEIVDTPGLDDPITKREEITKSYIMNCDLLIHVMNASCVATQIDIDFILESLLEQNISRLLIVLTRIDLISERELAQSLEYTKTSLVAQLKKAQYDGDIDSLIERIDFIPTASFLALLHKTDRVDEALQKGFSLEKTGIPDVESYLDRMLLGENSLKQKDILYLAYRGFLKIVQSMQEDMILEAKILNASEQELEGVLENLKEENKKLLEKLQIKQNELSEKRVDLKEFLFSLQNFVNTSLKKEQEKLKGRIYDEAVYAYGHNGMPGKERIIEILESGFSDCFSDLSRDYKYKLAKKITQIFLDEQADIKQPQIIFYAPKEQIAKSLTILYNSVPGLISSHSKKDQAELLIRLDEKFTESFMLFSSVIKEKNEEIETKFFAYFDEIARAQDNVITLQIAQKEEMIQNTLAKRNAVQSKDSQQAFLLKQKELDNIAGELAYITQALK